MTRVAEDCFFERKKIEDRIERSKATGPGGGGGHCNTLTHRPPPLHRRNELLARAAPLAARLLARP